jgi:ceramide glucosyltransferase
MPPLVLALVLVVAWTYLVATTVAAFRFARRPIERPAAHAPVSVLTPLHGAEPGLYENLCSFADLGLSRTAARVGRARPDDSASPIARRLIEARLHRDIALVIDPRVAGSNLKVANLDTVLRQRRQGRRGAERRQSEAEGHQ